MRLSCGNLIGYLTVRQGAHKNFGNNENMKTRHDENRRAAIEQQIDENLKRVYEQDATQKIPDKLLDLLNKLREQE